VSSATPARRIALDIIQSMRKDNAFVNPLIEDKLRQGSVQLSTADRAFVVQLARGVAATYGELDLIIERSNTKTKKPQPRLLDILRLATYEMAFLKKEPAVALNQAVELAKLVVNHAAGTANALLHRVAAELESFPWGDPATSLEALAHQQAFPLWLAQRLVDDLGWAAATDFMQASNLPAPLYLVDLRTLESLQIEAASLPQYYPQLDKGELIVADRSTQEVAHLAQPAALGRYLEVGSGRGTKTVLLQRAAQLQHGAQTEHYALDLHAYKHEVLGERLVQCGLTGVTAVVGDAQKLDHLIDQGLLPAIFSGALIDAPCSNTGTLRRHPEARWRLTPEAVSEMAELGLAMLRAVAPTIAAGGFVVYSTCSVLCEEDEQVIEAFLGSTEGAGFSLCQPVFRPALTSGSPDAHFAAKLIRD
jgi:16S rRNA (cytosine967-C5)-methyltransferase